MNAGRERCMIYRPATRRLDDACDTCGKSETYCHARTDLRLKPCCQTCTHETAE